MIIEISNRIPIRVRKHNARFYIECISKISDNMSIDDILNQSCSLQSDTYAFEISIEMPTSCEEKISINARKKGILPEDLIKEVVIASIKQSNEYSQCIYVCNKKYRDIYGKQCYYHIKEVIFDTIYHEAYIKHPTC